MCSFSFSYLSAQERLFGAFLAAGGCSVSPVVSSSPPSRRNSSKPKLRCPTCNFLFAALLGSPLLLALSPAGFCGVVVVPVPAVFPDTTSEHCLGASPKGAAGAVGPPAASTPSCIVVAVGPLLAALRGLLLASR